MLIEYIIFCFGAGLLQSAWVKTPTRGLSDSYGFLDVPLVFAETRMQILLPIIGLGSLIAEIAVGWILISWWAGIFLWIPALLVASIVIPSKNPAPSFFIGILIIIGSVISFSL